MKRILLTILLLLAPVPAFAVFTEPTLPTATVTTTLPTGWDGTADATPANAAALTTALAAIDQNVGNPYIIELTAGVTYAGQFKLPNKTGTDWVIIRSSNYASLPAGTRVTPADVADMPKIQSIGATAAMYAELEAHKIRLIGIEITTDHAVTTSSLSAVVYIGYDPVLGQSATVIEDQPTNIIFDRCYVHGTTTGNVFRGILLDGTYCAVIDSNVSEGHVIGSDAQAILVLHGGGPFLLHNNRLEGSGENVMFGGGDPNITNLVPSDITITRNHFYKPLSWKSDDPSYAGKAWTVKNLLEFKNARRVLVEGNKFENCWPHAQAGYAIVITPRNQDNTAPWCTTEDITFRKNWVTNTQSGFQLLSEDSIWVSLPIKRVVIDDNLVECDSLAMSGGTGGRIVTFTFGGLTAESVRFQHNTMLHMSPGAGILIMGESDTICDEFIWKDNICSYGEYGVFASGDGSGTSALNFYLTNHDMTYNAFIMDGATPVTFPATNLFPAEVVDVDFTNYGAGDYSLDPGSPYAGAASDSEDIGVDWAALQAALAGEGQPEESTLLLINSAAGLLSIEVAE